jgi:hypothetical protein
VQIFVELGSLYELDHERRHIRWSAPKTTILRFWEAEVLLADLEHPSHERNDLSKPVADVYDDQGYVAIKSTLYGEGIDILNGKSASQFEVGEDKPYRLKEFDVIPLKTFRVDGHYGVFLPDRLQGLPALSATAAILDASWTVPLELELEMAIALAKNPALPPRAFYVFTHVPILEVLEAVAQNPSLPDEYIPHLSTLVPDVLAKNPATTFALFANPDLLRQCTPNFQRTVLKT